MNQSNTKPTNFDKYVPPTALEIRAGKKSNIGFVKGATEKDFTIMALMEFLEDTVWYNGSDTKDLTLEDVKNKHKSWFNSIKDDESHAGDCVKLPITCSLCLCEDKLFRARKFIKFVNNEYISQY